MKKKSETLKLIEMYLLECEIKESELMGRYNGVWHDIEVLDVLGIAEEKATLYGNILISVDGIEKCLSFTMFNKWAFVYKDEYIEIIEDLGTLIIELFYENQQKNIV